MTGSERSLSKARVPRGAQPGPALLALGWALAAGGPLEGHALEWRVETGHRWAPVESMAPGRPGFRLLPPAETGVRFTNEVAQARYVTNQIYLNGSGVAAGDFDGDGWCDLFFCSIDRPNVLFRNRGGLRFEDVTADAGVGLPHQDCTGATAADLDGDGDLDLAINSVGQGTFLLFNDGRGRFQDAAPGSPLNYLRGGMSLALADVDGDGDLDLYVVNYRTTTLRDMPNTRLRISNQDGRLTVVAVNDRPTTEPDLVGRFTVTPDGRYLEHGEPDVLYLNDGRGRFTAVPFTGGAFLNPQGEALAEPPYDWGLTGAFRDLNGDGAPDLYVCNDFESPDRIWINDGNGRFRALPMLALRQTSIFSMGVDFADLDRDGQDEVFVSDMLSRDHAKRMLETGDIQPTVLPLGVGDNRPQYSHNVLFYNRGDGTYAEISQFAGVEASEWTWSPSFLDVDLDGYEDLLITTGHELQMMNGDIINRAEVMKSQKQMSNHELQRLRTLFPRYAIPNVAFRNRGDLTFEDASQDWGFDHPDVGNGVALVDLDNDADLDVVINNLNGPAEVYLNVGTAPRIAVRLKGQAANTQGIGAKVTVLGGAVPRQSQEIVCGGRYLSGGEAIRVFAAGTPTNRLILEVAWRSGKRSRLTGLLANRIYEIDEAAAERPAPASAASRDLRGDARQSVDETGQSDSAALPQTRPRLTATEHDLEVEDAARGPWFEDVSDLLGHVHHETLFDDFARQPLLPYRLSQLGPGVSWLDVDDDGWDDLVVGSGRGGRLSVYRNQQNGRFAAFESPVLQRPAGRDQTTIVGLRGALVVGSSNYDDGTTNGGWVRIADLRRPAAGESVLGPTASTGPLALGDVDNDGELDLFIGGRVVPGRYPEPATSLFMRKEGERLVVGQRFEKLGLVSGAVFSDLDGDGALELILACEWGPIRILRYRDGHFVPWPLPLVWPAPAAKPTGRGRNPAQPARLEALTGWWAGVATGDLDGDGRLDIVASNWGLNSRYRPVAGQPIRIHYGDLGGDGGVDIIESYVNPATGHEVPRRGLGAVVAALPFLQEKAESLEAYGQATLMELYGERLRPEAVVEAVSLASMAFLNRGDHFEAHPLPSQAQWAPAFGVCIADANGDGREDVFLSQNLFATSPDYWRHDSGRGLWLRGDGRGGLTPVSGQASGVIAYGEQRGCAVSDYDADGRPDLVVSQNAAPTKLFRNRAAKPGLRVRLVGPPGNPQAVGAAVRIRFGERSGPLREVQAGSGYWSHNSLVQVLATPEAPTAVWVRWPGGKMTTSPVAAGAREVSLAQRDAQ